MAVIAFVVMLVVAGVLVATLSVAVGVGGIGGASGAGGLEVGLIALCLVPLRMMALQMRGVGLGVGSSLGGDLRLLRLGRAFGFLRHVQRAGSGSDLPVTKMGVRKIKAPVGGKN